MCQKLNDLLHRPTSWSLFAFCLIRSQVYASDNPNAAITHTGVRENRGWRGSGALLELGRLHPVKANPVEGWPRV